MYIVTTMSSYKQHTSKCVIPLLFLLNQNAPHIVAKSINGVSVSQRKNASIRHRLPSFCPQSPAATIKLSRRIAV